MVIILLDNVRSAHNVGSVFRTADGASVGKIYLTGVTPYPPHPKIPKTALGAENYIPFNYVKSGIEVVEKYKEKGFEILAIEQTNLSSNIFEHKFKDNTLFIFGNELTGVSKELLNLCDNHLELPMLGKKHSLNVSNTVAIVLYHYLFKTKY